MATTTTTTQTSTSSLSILADYELHHSGSEVPQLPERVPVSHAAQPASWPSNSRRIPAYRPVDRELDQSERPAGSNPAEFVFIQVMLHGVWLNAVGSALVSGISPKGLLTIHSLWLACGGSQGGESTTGSSGMTSGGSFNHIRICACLSSVRVANQYQFTSTLSLAIPLTRIELSIPFARQK